MMEGGDEEKETPRKMCAKTRGAGWPRGEDSRDLMSKHIKNDSALTVESEENMADSPINVSVTGITGGHAEKIQVIGINQVTGPDPLHDILERTKDEVEDMTAGMIRVSAVDVVVEKLSSGQHWVTITGNAGDGKTTLGYLVLEEFQKKGVGVSTLYKPEEYDLVSKVKEDMVIMFDDRFGAFRADEQKVDKWFDVIQRIFRCQKNKANNKVLFISRRNVVNESKDDLGHLTDSVFNKKVVVDLSERTSSGERMKILEHHLGQENVSINPDIKKRVCTMRVAHGFPHCCKMIARFISEGYDVPIEQFFRSPLDFLDKTTKVLYKGKCRDLFQIMIKHDGYFDFNSIDDGDKRQKLLEVEKEQEGSYITKWRNGICHFAHPSVYESVLNVMNDIDPRTCVKYATFSVIRQKMIISTTDEEDRSRSACYIIVKPFPAVLKALAERFREGIFKGDYSVFKHRLCQSREFCEALVSCCVTTDERETSSKQFINRPGKDGATMLCAAARSRRLPAVHCLVKADADVNIQDKRGRTPLHYICQLKNSAGASTEGNEGDDKHKTVDLDTVRLVITEGRGDVNIGDQYGRTPLHCLCQVMNSAAAVGHYDDKLHRVVINAMKLIITEGRGDVNIGDQYGQTPLHCLCQVGNFAVADGHNDDKLQDMIINAMQCVIIEGSGDINISDRFGKTPLHYLFKSYNFTTEEIGWIITQGKGDLNKCEQHRSTPLHYLCANSDLQLDTVDLVIMEGKGDFNKGDEYGTTPFHFICDNGKLELDLVLQIVNTAKGDINKQDDNGVTPLHVLCKGSLLMKDILTLINRGDKADMYGNTPLHFLCRRRGMNAEVLQQQLEQIPETDRRKLNNLGYTALDYLTDQDDSLPWTDGMIARSAADLVLCRFKQGDNWIYVLGREMILNSERVHWRLQVEDFGRVLTNLEESRHRNSPGQFWGTCSSPVPVPPSPSPLTTPPSYWETSSTLTRRERGGLPLLEMGLIHGRRNMDEGFCVSALPSSVCVSVTDFCYHHPGRLCIQVRRRDQEDRRRHQVGECVSLSLPTPGVELTLTFGLVLDVGRGRVGFIDVERGQLLCKVDLQMKEEVSPMFYVDPDNCCATRMRLISGREIYVTDRKIHLIQQALSD